MNTLQKKLAMAFGIAGAVILVAGISGLTMFQIYYRVDDSKPTRLVARMTGLPAASVGTHKVTYDRFLKTRDAVVHFINSDAGKEVKAQMPPQSELNKSVLDRLVRQSIVQEIADQKKVSVSEEEVGAVFADVVKAAASSTTPNVSDYLRSNYGWNENDFKSEVLKPALLEQKLAQELAKENPNDQNAFETAVQAMRSSSGVVVYLKF